MNRNSLEFTGHGSREVYVVSHGWHTGFVVPARDIQSMLPELRQRFGDVSYIEFGWGDKGFYQAREITSGLTMRAIFWPTESVMHAVAVPVKAHQYFTHSDVDMLCLNENEYLSLLAFVMSSFEKTTGGKLIMLRNGIYGDSQFYQGVGKYYLFNTCNKWTAKGLKSIGLKMSPAFKLTAGSVMDALSDYRQPNNTACFGVEKVSVLSIRLDQ